jgi:hypothetical protein
VTIITGPALNSGPPPTDIEEMADQVAALASEGISSIGSDRATRQQRRHPRVPVAGKVRIVADTPEGVVTLTGNVIDLSVSGCAIRVYGRLEPDCEARLELEVDGERVWVPAHIVWTRSRERAWVVGMRFERLVPQKQSHILRLVAERRARTGI